MNKKKTHKTPSFIWIFMSIIIITGIAVGCFALKEREKKKTKKLTNEKKPSLPAQIKTVDSPPAGINKGFQPNAENAMRIAKVEFKEQDVDPRSGDGFSREELFKLHKELRQLVQKNYNQAPSKREKEILEFILCGKPKRTIDPKRYIRDKLNKKKKKKEKVILFYDGYEVNNFIHRYKATQNRAYLACAMVMADYIMTEYDSRKNDAEKFGPWAKGNCWLGLGRGYGGIAEMITVISKDPELHKLKGILFPGQSEEFKDLTYIQKARRWIVDLKNLIDFRKANDKYDNGKLYQTDKEIKYKGGPASTNRYLYYTHFLLAAATAAEAVDPVKYGKWSAEIRKMVDEIMEYFQRTFQRPEDLRQARSKNMEWSKEHKTFMSEYGPYVVWAYKLERDNTEDYIHLMMDIEAFDDIFMHNNKLLPEDVMQKIAVMLMTCTYNYETGRIPFNLDPKDSGPDQKKQKPWHTFYAPKYGKYIGKYLNNKAYDKFMARQFKVWDQQLLEGKLGRFSQYSMPQEILEARLFRYNKKTYFPGEK